LPLSKKARIEVYLPDVSTPAYRDLLDALEQEFTFTFGGCTTARGLDGNYLSHRGDRVRDRIHLVYTDTPIALEQNLTILENYVDALRRAAHDALEEETILIVVVEVLHGA